MVTENVENTPLVCGSGVSEAIGHRDVAVHAEGCDKKKSRAGKILSSLFGGNRSKHQERIKVHIPQLNQ